MTVNQSFNVKHDQLLTREEVAAILRIKPSALDRRIRAHTAPAGIIICGQLRWPTNLLNAWFNKHYPELNVQTGQSESQQAQKIARKTFTDQNKPGRGD